MCRFGYSLSLCILTPYVLTLLGCASAAPAPTPAAESPASSGSPAVQLIREVKLGADTELTGTAQRAALPLNALLGQGYSRIGGTLRGLALEVTPSDIVSRPDNAVSYDLKYVDSYEELARTLRITASASFSGFGVGASASMDLFRATRFTSTKAYGVVRMTVMTGTETLSRFRFRPEALRQLSGRSPRPASFLTNYGDAFVFQLARGAELYAVLEFSASTQEERQRLRVDMSAKYGAMFSASGSFEQTMSSLLKNREVRVLYSQSGGGVGRETRANSPKPDAPEYAVSGGVLIMTPEEFLGRIRDFPGEARSKEHAGSAPIIWGETLDYNIVENRPANSIVPPDLATVWLLESLGKAKVRLDELRETAREAATSGLYNAAIQKEGAQRLVYLEYATSELDRFGTALIAYPSLREKFGGVKLLSYAAFKHALKLPEPAPSPLFDKGEKDKVFEDGTCPLEMPHYLFVVDCLIGSEPFQPIPVTMRPTIKSGVLGTGNTPANQVYTIPFGFLPGEAAFSKAPCVVVSLSHGANHNQTDLFRYKMRAITTSNFTIEVSRRDNTGQSAAAGLAIYWIANEGGCN